MTSLNFFFNLSFIDYAFVFIYLFYIISNKTVKPKDEKMIIVTIRIIRIRIMIKRV